MPQSSQNFTLLEGALKGAIRLATTSKPLHFRYKLLLNADPIGILRHILSLVESNFCSALNASFLL